MNGGESRSETFRPIERPAHELALEAERSAAEAPQARHSERGMQQAIGGNRAKSLRPRDPPRRSTPRTIMPSCRMSPAAGVQMDEWQGIVFDGWRSMAAQTTAQTTIS